MSESSRNKYRSAIEVLQKGRDQMVEGLADEINYHGDELVEEGYRFNEFLETQGTRLHFLTLLLCQLEQSAETMDETLNAPPPPPPKAPSRRRPRSKSKKKVEQNVSTEGSPDDL